MISMPNQNDGIDRPPIVTMRTSVVDPGVADRAPPVVPSGIAISTAMIVAMSATCSDNSRRSAISSDHRPLGPHRLAEVERREPDHPVAELLEQRLVEPEPLALLLDRFLRDVAAVAAQLDLDDVARHDAQHEEHEHRDADQRRDHQQDAVDGVAEHRVCTAAEPPSSRPRWAGEPSTFAPSARRAPFGIPPPRAGEGRVGTYWFSQTSLRSAPRLWLGDIFQPITALWVGTMRCHHKSGCW